MVRSLLPSAVIGGLMALTLAGPALAEWPDRPITWIVPWGAGGAADQITRVLAPAMEKELGVPINVVRESVAGGQRRIFIVFERWTQFAELRGGYRSLDYPFGVIELNIDEATGKGEGTYIAAAQIRWRQDKRTNQYQVEIENFATYPAKLMGVTRRGRR